MDVIDLSHGCLFFSESSLFKFFVLIFVVSESFFIILLICSPSQSFTLLLLFFLLNQFLKRISFALEICSLVFQKSIEVIDMLILFSNFLLKFGVFLIKVKFILFKSLLESLNFLFVPVGFRIKHLSDGCFFFDELLNLNIFLLKCFL